MEIVCPPKIGEIIEGKVINKSKNSLFLDLGAKGIGIIYGREFFEAKQILKNLMPEDRITAKVINLETEDGYRELSLMEAHQELAWKDLIKAKENQETFEVQVKNANKGGVICQIKGINGFLPASQLSPEHYPKVEGADSAKIAQELQKLVGKKISVKIFDISINENKLILSEKTVRKEKTEKELLNYKEGDVIEGEISGVTNFGAFLNFNNGLEGLISASEISDTEGNNSPQVLKVGQKIKAKIIEIANNRIYLSLKNLSLEQ